MSLCHFKILFHQPETLAQKCLVYITASLVQHKLSAEAAIDRKD